MQFSVYTKFFSDLSAYAKYSWFVLFYNIPVILYGAYVRATGSGAGCGDHWPRCNGQVIPTLSGGSEKTLVEFSHRVTSGLSLIFVFVGFLWALRRFPAKHRVRRSGLIALVVIIVEALLGAGLVVFGLVDKDDSIARAFSMGLHLVNTFILLLALTVHAWYASGGLWFRWFQKGRLHSMQILGLLALLMIGVTGAVAALGDTLFPGVRGLVTDGHTLLILRNMHPFAAIAFAMPALYAAVQGLSYPEKKIKQMGIFVIVLIFAQWLIGFINIFLAAPVFMQLIHLFFADIIWIIFSLFAILARSKIESN